MENIENGIYISDNSIYFLEAGIYINVLNYSTTNKNKIWRFTIESVYTTDTIKIYIHKTPLDTTKEDIFKDIIDNISINVEKPIKNKYIKLYKDNYKRLTNNNPNVRHVSDTFIDYSSNGYIIPINNMMKIKLYTITISMCLVTYNYLIESNIEEQIDRLNASLNSQLLANSINYNYTNKLKIKNIIIEYADRNPNIALYILPSTFMKLYKRDNKYITDIFFYKGYFYNINDSYKLSVVANAWRCNAHHIFSNVREVKERCINSKLPLPIKYQDYINLI